MASFTSPSIKDKLTNDDGYENIQDFTNTKNGYTNVKLKPETIDMNFEKTANVIPNPNLLL